MRIRPKKIGLRIGGKIFWCVKLGHFDGEKENEEGRREVQEVQVWNISFCMELLFGNTCLSWVRKTLTLQYMCILVGLSQFSG